MNNLNFFTLLCLALATVTFFSGWAKSPLFLVLWLHNFWNVPYVLKVLLNSWLIHWESAAHIIFLKKNTPPTTTHVIQQPILWTDIDQLPYVRHYNPRFVYFLPTFWSPKTFFQGAFFLKFWSYVWLVFKSGFKSRAGYDGTPTVYALAYIISG